MIEDSRGTSKMIKHVFAGFLSDVNQIEAERWYFRFHSREVVRYVGPWLRRYETYRLYSPPPDSERFGTRNGYLTELWYDSIAAFLEADANGRAYTRLTLTQTDIRPRPPAITMVPARPTEDFLGKEPFPEEKTILRWYCVFKYPDGIATADGEKWYLEVHSQEVKQQPGLLRYVSHRAVEDPPFPTPWVRVSELWYEDFDSWRRANVESPPQYTSPPWDRADPFVDMVSVFAKYKPDVDFLRDNPLVP